MKRRSTAARGLYPSGLAAALLLACMMLLGGAGLCAQDTSKIPTLKVWYEVPGVTEASFLENFDTANGGRYALSIRKYREPRVLYNRSANDTTNMFTWGKWGTGDVGYWAGRADFNGDGVSDYLLDEGIIYRGVTKNAPPDPTPVANYDIPFWALDRRCIADFNGDGKDDLLERVVEDPPIGSAPSGPIVKIILGNSDLTKMEVVDVPQIRGVTDDIQNIVSAWRENGKNYMVIYQYENAGYDPRTDLFILYEFSIDSARRVHYNPLDTTPFGIWPTGSTPYYNFSSSFVWHSRDGKEHTLVVSVLKDASTQVFRIVNGRFVYRWTKTRREGSSKILTHGIRSLATTG